MQKKVLISGGSGLIGKEISRQLLDKGYTVSHFSRSANHKNASIKVFEWDVEKGTYDKAAFEQNPDFIINLAGAPLNKRWSPTYKSEILKSRTESIRLLYKGVQEQEKKPQAFISTSAVGYYPNALDETYAESAAPGKDFLSEVCIAWEREARLFENLGIRTVINRVGIVLSMQGGALPQIVKPIRFGFGAPLASGKQWMPWIHLEDVASVYVRAMEETGLEGAANAVGPYSVTNEDFTKMAAMVLQKPLFLPNVPAFVLKLMLGEMAEIALTSNNALNTKLESIGFQYKYKTLEQALQALLK
jgi:uncharacterized protein (TIGR01777 family)